MRHLRPFVAGIALLSLAPLPDRMSREQALAALAAAECSTCPPREQAAVVAVALNRAEGKSLEQVLLAPGQFADLGAPWATKAARRRARPAVRMAMRGYDPTNGATHFHTHWVCDRNPRACWHPEIDACADTVWPTLDEIEVPADWLHRYYREQ